MNARTTSEIARHARCGIPQARHASTAAVSSAPARTPKAQDPEHGRNIWVYSHLQKNNVVYSLTKALKNNASLRQIPFNGKKTVPAALRKDLWHPLAKISFSSSPNSGAIGLSAYQKLREYRRRHELEWDASEFNNFKDEEGKFIPKKKRGRLLCDQKANSIADMAAVLSRLGVEQNVLLGDEGTAKEEGSIGLIGAGSGEKVLVQWWNLKDAEFAETWSENVEHDVLELQTNNRDPERRWRKKQMEGLEGAEYLDTREQTAEKVTL